MGAFTSTPESERWLAFAVGCAVLAVLSVAFLVPRRGAVQRVLDLPTALICAWLIVCSRAVENAGAGASVAAVKWFNLAAGAVLFGVGAIGLLLHEFELKRDLDRVVSEPWLVWGMRTRAPEGGSRSGDGVTPESTSSEERYADAVSRSAG
jgi:hypothetical protein